MVSFIAEPASLRGIDVNQLGGKGKNLAVLMSNAIPVPEWFCVLSSVYRSLIDPIKEQVGAILDTVDYADYKSLNRASARIHTLITSRRLNREAEDAITARLNQPGNNKFFSVRSSALKEDSAEFSFAGLFETYLYVPSQKVVSKLYACWSSLFSDRALSYFHKNGISPLDVDMAVIVQEMVASTKSGILFQTNPTGRLEESVIVAGYGLGEGIVSNEIETDTFYYNQIEKTFKSIISRKQKQLKFDSQSGSGVTKHEVPVSEQDREVLTGDELTRLMLISNKIAEIYDNYQDIEWAVTGDGEIFILQSRPITTIPLGEINLYDNSNISENYPGITLPLTGSVVRNFYAQNFLTTYRNIGFSPKYINEFEKYFVDLISVIQGKIYYNLTNWYRALSVLGGTSTVFSFFEDMIGARKNRASERIAIHPLVKLKVSLITWWAYLNWKRKFAKYKREFNHIYSLNQQALSNGEFGDLGKFYLKAAGDFWKLGDITCRNSYYVMLLTGLIKSQLKQLAPLEAEDIFNSLLVGEEGIESVQPLISIINMAQMVRASDGLKEALTKGTLFKEPIRMKEDFPGFYEAFEHHLKMYGDRGALELKLECKTFRQKPQNLSVLIVSYAESGITLQDMSKQRTQLRLDAEQKLAFLLRGKPLKRMFINYILKKTRFFIKNRESGRLDRTRIYGFVREIFLRIAGEWVRDGIIATEDDIFYLTEKEVVANTATPNMNTLRELIKRRKREWADFTSREPADRIFLRGDIDKNYIPQKEQESTLADEQGVLRGLGCCPGVVIGEAVVLKSPNENEIVKDKILVAINTDPGWVFWIMASKGLIVEKGNLLSHTAIIGRELGKPTIVCVPGATEKIPQNSLIKMDGLKGTIQILEPETEQLC